MVDIAGDAALVGTSTLTAAATVTTPVTLPVQDTFNRADAPSLGTTSDGKATWNVLQFAAGTPGATSSIVTNTGRVSGYASIALIPLNVADADVTATYVESNSAHVILAARYVDESNYIYWRADGVLRQRIAGVNTELTGLTTFAAADIVKLQIIGSTAKLFKNGAALNTVTLDAAAPKSGSWGFGHGSGADNFVRVDNFDLTASSTAQTITGAAPLTGTSTLTAAGTHEQFAAVPLTGTSVLVADATVQANISNMTSTSTLTVGGHVEAFGTANLVGTSTLTSGAFVTALAAAPLVGTSILTVRAKAYPVIPILQASPGIREVLLQWTTSGSATGYRLRRAGVVVYDGAATSYNDTGLANGTLYDYTVTAYNIHNESPPSSVVVATTALAPVTPSAFTVVGQCDQVSTFWDPVVLAVISDNFDRADGPVGATSGGGVTWQ